MKTLLSAIFALSFTCCLQAQNASTKTQINSNIIARIKRNAHDPDSYQFVSTTLLDTLRRSDKIKKEVHTEMNAQKVRLETYKILMEGNNKEEFAKVQSEMDNSKQQIDSLIAVMQDMRAGKRADPSVGYAFLHQCRLKNQFGALVLKTYRVNTDKAFKITSLKELE